jgi:hypothetical protein
MKRILIGMIAVLTLGLCLSPLSATEVALRELFSPSLNFITVLLYATNLIGF